MDFLDVWQVNWKLEEYFSGRLWPIVKGVEGMAGTREILHVMEFGNLLQTPLFSEQSHPASLTE